MVQAITAAPKFDQQQHGNENVPTAAKQKHTFIFQNCSRTLAAWYRVTSCNQFKLKPNKNSQTAWQMQQWYW